MTGIQIVLTLHTRRRIRRGLRREQLACYEGVGTTLTRTICALPTGSVSTLVRQTVIVGFASRGRRIDNVKWSRRERGAISESGTDFETDLLYFYTRVLRIRTLCVDGPRF